MAIAATLDELRVPIDSVRAYGRNPRRGDLPAIKRSLEVNGQYRPIVANRRTGEVLAGNHTWLAARELDWPEIAATFVDVDDEEAARIVLADNRTAELGGYDDAELAALLASLPGLEGTAWQDRELERLLARIEKDGVDAGRDTEPGPRPARPRTKPGDLYQLGAHRLLCGDSTRLGDVERVLAGDQVDMVWTDPPYGVAYVDSRGRSLANDDLSAAALEELLRSSFQLAHDACKPGGGWYVMSPSGPSGIPFIAVLRELRIYRQGLVWVKDAFTLNRQDYHYQHELILYGWRSGTHRFYGGYAESALRDDEPDIRQLDRRQLMALVRELRNARETDIHRVDRSRVHEPMHPTLKPIDLVVRHVANSSRPGEIVYDPFAGAGTTLIACENLGRRGLALELDPGYCDVIVDRWQRHTGEKATRP